MYSRVSMGKRGGMVALTALSIVAAVLLLVPACLAGVRWTANGVAISAATGDQYEPRITSDGSGGAIIT